MAGALLTAGIGVGLAAGVAQAGPPNFNCGLFWCPVPPHA
jgi:hypothetical protein